MSAIKKDKSKKISQKLNLNFDIDFNLKSLITELDVKITEPTVLKRIKNLLKEVNRDISIFQLNINNPKKEKNWIDLETKFGNDLVDNGKLPLNTSHKFGYGYYPLLKLLIKYYDIDPFLPQEESDDNKKHEDSLDIMDKAQIYIENMHKGIDTLPLHLKQDITSEDEYMSSVVTYNNILLMKTKNDVFIEGLSKGKIESDKSMSTVETVDIKYPQNFHKFLLRKLDESILEEFNYRNNFKEELNYAQRLIKKNQSKEITDESSFGEMAYKQIIDSRNDIEVIKNLYAEYILIKKGANRINQSIDKINAPLSYEAYKDAERHINFLNSVLFLINNKENHKSLVYVWWDKISLVINKDYDYLENITDEEVDKIFEDFSNTVKFDLAYYEKKILNDEINSILKNYVNNNFLQIRPTL